MEATEEWDCLQDFRKKEWEWMQAFKDGLLQRLHQQEEQAINERLTEMTGVEPWSSSNHRRTADKAQQRNIIFVPQ